MSDRSAIEWTDASWNPLRARNTRTGAIGWHCTHKSEGCRNCYAEGFNNRLGTKVDYKPGAVVNGDVQPFLDEHALLIPLKWRKPRRIFVCSMTDIFGEWVTDHQLDRIFAVMALRPQHTFHVLTKRAERMREYVRSTASVQSIAMQIAMPVRLCERITREHGIATSAWPLPNVWLGVSCEDQATADERIPLLLDTPATVRFISAEPLLGKIDLTAINRLSIVQGRDALRGPNRLDWVICGGESGPNARPMHPDWARSLRDQCSAASVAFFFKQWGEFLTDDGYPGESHRVGKKRAGRLLDGVEHSEFPQVQR